MKAWEAFLRQQELEIGTVSTQRWLRSLKILHFDSRNLYLEAEDRFQIAWFEEHMRLRIRQQLRSNHHPIRVHLRLKQPPTAAPRQQQAPLCVSKLDPLATFEHWIASPANALPCQLLSNLYARSQPATDLGNPLFLYGARGVGKSHLLMASAQKWQQEGKKVLYLAASTFSAVVLRARRNDTIAPLRRFLRSHDLLLIDDLQTLARREMSQEELFHTFNALHSSGRQLVLAASLPPAALPLAPRLTSRCEWGLTLALQELPVAQAWQLLQQRLCQRQLRLDGASIDYLYHTFAPGLLCQAVDALALRLPPARKTVPVAVITPLLADLPRKARDSGPQQILQAVASACNLPVTEIIGKSSAAPLAAPRQLAIYLCRHKLQLSLPQIGRLFARHHSTILRSIQQLEGGKKDAPAIQQLLGQIESRLAPIKS